jgi:hypothetical protein
MSAFLGSVWFSVMLALAGYLVGHWFPVSRVGDWFKR